ncbi:MAG: uracil phosphoribosyltransferase [Alphaproteobacteria bacterium]|nr:uracil phosphoribosyltransferase [Alphaproteobacteria bacterium]
MTPDSHYLQLPRPRGGVEHDYGERVHLLSFPYAMSLLAELSSPRTTQPRFNQILYTLYEWMLAEIASRELATKRVEVPTRMQAINPEGVYQGEVIDREQRVVIVALARAGILPGMRFFDGLNHLLDPKGVRQDHVFMGRVTNASGEVVGVDVSGSKIGGPVDDATVLVPDPMGATGRSAIEALKLYRDKIEGKPRALITAHLIITPEYLARVAQEVPEATVYAIRLDRGLSAAEVLAERPGARHAQERGLNDSQYIVPGAGGLGELMNNAWV